MNQLKILLFIILSILDSCLGLADLNKPQKHCIKQRSHKMIGYDCAKLELREVPKKLQSSTEVLDISQNRIKELTRDSFSTLTDLKFLYLFENMINRIEDDTFAALINLEALDISANGLLNVPPEIFNLPLLRNLYMADNSFGDQGFDTLEKISRPVKAPLKILNIAQNRLRKMPDLGILPELVKLNISSNPMHSLRPQDFSPFCHLNEVDLNNTAMGNCQCEEVTRFLYIKRDANTYLFYCDASSSECKKIDRNVTFAETPDYEKCLQIRKAVVEHKKAQLTWGIIGLSVVGFLVIFIGCLYCLHRRNVRQMRKRSKINNQNVITVKDSNLEQNLDESTQPEKLLIKKSNV